MSLNRYLFLTFAALIVVIFAVQIAVTGYMQQNYVEAVHKETQQRINDAVNDQRFNDVIIRELRQQMRANHIQQHQQHQQLAEQTLSAHTQAQLTADNARLQQQARELRAQLRQHLQKLATNRRHMDHPMGMGMRGHAPPSSDARPPAGPFGASLLLTRHPAFWGGMGVSLLIGLLATWLLSNRISQPLRRLSAAHHRVAEGELGYQLPPEGPRELKQTMTDFNQMSEQLSQWQQLLQRQQQLEQLAELGEISRGMAHALRSPLHVISLSIEALLDVDDREQKQQLQQQITQQITIIDRHIQQLLSLRQDTSPSSLIDFNELLDDLELELSSRPPHPHIKRDVANNAVSFNGHAIELRNMLHTLLTNAIEVSPEQGTIHITIEQRDGYHFITITDQGPGLSASIKEHLFEPHISSKAEGAGMGLYIARRQAQLHYDGDIWLQDQASGGCIATLKLKDNDDE